MSELISVIITCHNLERYIGEAIESVLTQDYEGPVELLVVDDASTDRSAQVIQRYPSAVYLATPNNIGVLMATVSGLQRASGDVVFFLDGDDIWRSDKLRLCMQRFDTDPKLGLLTHDLAYMDANGTLLGRVSRPSQVFGDQPVDGEWVRRGILNHTDYVWLGSAYAVRRSAIGAEGFCAWAERLPDPFNTYQDWPLAYWAASQPDVTMAYVPKKLFNYRLHGANYSGDASNVQKVLRNLRRAFNTMDAILDITNRAGLQGETRKITLRKRAFYEYLLHLYSGKRLSAAWEFFASQPYLFNSAHSPGKEWVRFIGIQALGVKQFVRVAARRTAAVS